MDTNALMILWTRLLEWAKTAAMVKTMVMDGVATALVVSTTTEVKDNAAVSNLAKVMALVAPDRTDAVSYNK